MYVGPHRIARDEEAALHQLLGRLEGAIFNERTILPFDRKEAEKRGMIFTPSKEVASKRARL